MCFSELDYGECFRSAGGAAEQPLASWLVTGILKCCIGEALNLYTYIKLIFDNFPFFYTCYRSAYYLMNKVRLAV